MSISKCGVGCEMSKMIPDWAVQFKGRCGCKDMERKMDHWGPDGCERRSSIIVAHLLAQSDHLVPMLASMPEFMRKAVAERMLRKSISNARKAVGQA